MQKYFRRSYQFQLVFRKCRLSILLYGLEACFLTLSDIRSLHFAVNRFLMKLFKTVNMEIIQDCRDYTSTLDYQVPSTCGKAENFRI